MFSKEQSQRLRQEFWTSFGKSFPRKWILYHTTIKGLAFKFFFDNKKAFVALDVEGDIEQRIKVWGKLSSLKTIITRDYLPEALFEEIYYLDNGKDISRIWIPLEHKVSIHNKNNWREVMLFFVDKMTLFESFFEDYKDVIDPK